MEIYPLYRIFGLSPGYCIIIILDCHANINHCIPKIIFSTYILVQ